MEVTFQHDVDRHCFYTTVDDQRCELKYDVVNHGIFDYVSTYVPEKLRDQGIASKLVQYGLDYAQKRDIQIIPTCSFVKRYVERHPQYATIVKK